jgi:FAD/FMN-containing dehydrogenase
MDKLDASDIGDLIALVGSKAIQVGGDAAAYMTDWRGRHEGQAMAVAVPASAEEAARIVGFCRERKIAIYPQGGNTGLCAGGVPPAGTQRCIVLSAGRLRQVREIDPVGDVAVVESGVVLSALHEAALAKGRVFPLHLGAVGSAQIGGLISTNAGGTGALRYGVMRDLVMGLEAVLPDGRIVRRLGGLRKDNRGYDWKHLLIGGEGSLGFVTAAALKLFPALRDAAHAACIVEDPAAAVDLYLRLRERFDTAIQAFELISGGEAALALRHVRGLRTPFDPLPKWMVMVELGGADPDGGLSERLTAFLEEALTRELIFDAVVPADIQQADDLWAVRHSLSEGNKKEGHGIVFDVAVRVSRVPAFIAAATALVERHTPLADPLYVCHLGDGNVHVIAMISRARVPAPAELAAMAERLQDAVHDLVEDMGGSFSAEHGIGRKLVPELARRLPPPELRLMRQIKGAIDPDNLFAPGVVLEEKAESH